MFPNAQRIADRWLKTSRLAQPEPSDIRWKPDGTGNYTGIGGRVLVDLRRKLVLVDGTEYPLPRKPSFGHAEGILKKHFGW